MAHESAFSFKTLNILAAFFISFCLTFFVLTFLLKKNFALDQPNSRSLHANPTPRSGGIAVMLGIFAGWTFLSLPPWPFLTGLILIISISLVDDLIGMPVLARFVVHFLAAYFFSTLIPSLNFLWTFILLISIVWMTNLYNFMDGSDGLAGGMAFFGFAFYGIAAWMAGNHNLSFISLSVSACAAAFLLFNFHPAKIFMGDTGSVPLGFLAATLGFYGWHHDNWPIWFPVAVFSPFIVDATVTLLKRFLRREKIWQAHKDHYYQRLIQMGVGHKNTALYEYVLMVAAGTTSLLTLGQETPYQVIALIFWISLYAYIMIVIDHRWKQFIRK